LKQGYPCLQGIDAVLAVKPLVARQAAHRRATSAALGSPRGQGKKRAPDTRSRSGPATWKASDPVHSGWTSEKDPGPFRVGSRQIITGSQDSGAGNTQAPPWKGSGAGTCPGIAPRSPLGQKPTAAAWLVAHDISRPTESDVRQLRSCGLRIYCGEDAPPATKPTDDVPPQHLMCPVYSTGRRRQTARLPNLSSNNAPVPCGASCSLSLLQEASPARRRYTDLGRQDTRGLPRQQIFIVPSVIFSMSLGPHVEAQCLCACPLSYKRGGMRRYKADPISDSQYIIQWSRVLRPGGPNHSKPLCALVCSSTNLVTSKTLRPLLILGIRAGAIRHPAGEIYSPTGRLKGKWSHHFL
jgi:hypothetical protein